MQQLTLTPPAEEMVQITSVSVLLNLVVEWQKQVLGLLNHLKAIPPGTEVSQEDNSLMFLEGDALAGFQLGLSLAIEEVSSLPFKEIPDDIEETQDTTDLPATTVTGS